MKLLPLLLLNLATIGVALVVYDQLRSDPAPATAVETASADTSALERRLDALEDERRPSLTATGADPRLLERLEALEAALGAPAATEDHPADEPAPAIRAPADGESPAPIAPLDEPGADEIREFRRLSRAVQREDRMKKNAPRVNGALEKLSLQFTKTQRTKIHEAFADLQPRIGEFWAQARTQAKETAASGGTINRGEIVATTTALIQQEFAKSLDGVVPAPDAEAVAAALMPGGR